MDVIFESDNEMIVRVLTAKKKCPNLYANNVRKDMWVGRVMSLRQNRFKGVDFSHVGRKGNGPAHKLAQHTLTKSNRIWLEETPSCIVTEVTWDLFNQ